MTRSFPVFTPVAEHSLLVEFGDSIDQVINARALALDSALTAAPFPGFLEVIPAYASLLIRFDPLQTDHDATEHYARGLLGQVYAPKAPSQREVLVCYDADLAPDLATVASAAGLTEEAVIAAHLAGRYDVFMYGFAPGYAYLAGVPEPIRLPRKPAAVRGGVQGQCADRRAAMPGFDPDHADRMVGHRTITDPHSDGCGRAAVPL